MARTKRANSGQTVKPAVVTVRMGASLHQQLLDAAYLQRVSLNEFCVRALGYASHNVLMERSHALTCTVADDGR
jgi:predicted HicB family RNase H-like nuclease